MTTRGNSPSDHLCQIVPVKRPSHAGIQPNARIVNGKPTSQAGSARAAIKHLKIVSGMGIY